ncbi:hypothetical protein EA462_03775 [Natrarchaeobius halalkaliphilus]|uniref:Uncharacterized protein n=1 Tax=Natrarchaeobius halalkaliphilus TaxID=1679091 RepID=A0A3N6P5Z9_9EURY|nr:hypothetical protein [Natrarchaeobius halalkaliphilus]RQG91125.1 hypothetical protein EA462_03775 [Natrarchaeobius halalkaliphilus]
MVSRENLVIVSSFVLLVLALAGIGIVDGATTVALGEYPLVMYLLFAGLTIVGPQLYLAATDDDVPPRTRVRFATIVWGLFALVMADVSRAEAVLGSGILGADLETLQHLAILAIGGGAFVALVCHEFVAGYRSQETDESQSAR